jgi:hypothetical protein
MQIHSNIYQDNCVLNLEAVNITMLVKTTKSVPLELISSVGTTSFDVMKTTINEPTGNFFYDPWKIKTEFVNTAWEKILEPLGNNIGEARVIVLDSPSCYTRHADIDDRYHLNISGEASYLLDFDNLQIHPLVNDGIWYEMDAGRLHSAIAAGKQYRIQLVVRKLLNRITLQDPIDVKLTLPVSESRYDFDNSISPWLNKVVKKHLLDNFKLEDNSVCFSIEKDCIKELLEIVPSTVVLNIY